MAVVLEPGVGSAMFAKLGAMYSGVASRIAIAEVAEAVMLEARKAILKQGSHAYRTPTPATAGGPPASISATLMNSIDRSPIYTIPIGRMIRIGTADGRFNPYQPGGKASSKYGLILEVRGCKDGSKYPFLEDAARHVFDVVAPLVYTKRYGQATVAWARIF